MESLNRLMLMLQFNGETPPTDWSYSDSQLRQFSGCELRVARRQDQLLDEDADCVVSLQTVETAAANWQPRCFQELRQSRGRRLLLADTCSWLVELSCQQHGASWQLRFELLEDGDEEGTATGDWSYQRWIRSNNKDDPRYYANPPFRQEYTENESSKRIDFLSGKLRHRISSLVQRQSVSILSLCCGPCCDVTALLKEMQAAARYSRVPLPKVTVEAVDLFDWPMHIFFNDVWQLQRSGGAAAAFPDLQVKFRRQEMQEFVGGCEQKFDIVMMSYGGITTRQETQFLANEVTQLLLPGGKIFVIDNNIPPVQQLATFGFKLLHGGERSSSVIYEFANDLESWMSRLWSH